MIHFDRKAFLEAARFSFLLALTALFCVSVLAQTSPTPGTATLRGTVTLGDSGKPIHNVLITVLQLKRTVGTDESGNYQIPNLPPGRYEVLAHLDRVPDMVKSIE